VRSLADTFSPPDRLFSGARAPSCLLYSYFRAKDLGRDHPFFYRRSSTLSCSRFFFTSVSHFPCPKKRSIFDSIARSPLIPLSTSAPFRRLSLRFFKEGLSMTMKFFFFPTPNAGNRGHRTAFSSASEALPPPEALITAESFSGISRRSRGASFIEDSS